VKAALPPFYVNTPVTIAYAEADDALIVTMTRILGLCWAYDYEQMPVLTPEQLAEYTGRPRSTPYRHLKRLREMQWIRVDQVGAPSAPLSSTWYCDSRTPPSTLRPGCRSQCR
jgi:hypothetical protein